MIKNPWPMHWNPIGVKWDDRYRLCRYGGRTPLFCAESEFYKDDTPACKNCFMRQQSMDSYQMKREGIRIERVCDRCGADIPDPDEVVYLDLQNHLGGYLFDKELCRDCAREVASWISNEAFTMPPPPRDEEAEKRIAYAFAQIAEEEHKKYIAKKERERKKKNAYMKVYMRQYRAKKKAAQAREKTEKK